MWESLLWILLGVVIGGIVGFILARKYLMNQIIEKVSFIAPVKLYPGEFEMESLGINAYKALINEVEINKL